MASHGIRGLRAGIVALALAAIVPMAAGCGGTGTGATGGGVPDFARATGKLEVHTLKVGALPITDLKQLFVADAKGFFRQEGLQVKIQNFEGGATIIPAVESGSVDIGWSNSVSIFQARARGLHPRFFAGGLYQGPGHWTSAVLVRKDSPIRRPEDLRGRTMAMNTLSNINELVMRAYLDRVGGGKAAPKFLEVPFPDQPAALMAGRVDAAVPTEPFVTAAKRQGARVLEAEPFAAIGPQPFVAAFFTTDAWLRDHPNTAAAFRRAVNRATIYWNDHPEERAAIIAHYTEVPLTLAEQISFGEPRTEIREQDLQSQIDLARRYGLLPRDLRASEVLAR